MFGSKKSKNISEKGKEFFAQITEKKEVFEANISQIEIEDSRIREDIAQVEENTCALVEGALSNVERESALLHSMEETKAEQSKAFSEYIRLSEGVKNALEACVELVEQNKHFTSPAKTLSEAPSGLREKNKSFEKHLEKLTDYRLDESNYEKEMLSLKKEIAESYKELQDMENTIHHMVSLLKESNMGATKLLKKCQDNGKLVEASAMRDFSEDTTAFRDSVMALRNQEEEIVKCGERNKLQITDIKEELQAVKRDFAEVDSDISYIMDLAEEQINR